MHTCSQRLVEVITMSLTTCLLCTLVVVGLTLLPSSPSPSSSPVISLFNVSMSQMTQMQMPTLYAQGVHPPPLRDYIFFKFSLRADFSPVWDWNTKAVYVSCVARYRTDRYVVNEVTLIDAVLRNREAWALDNVHKYALEEERLGALAGVQVQLAIRYQVIRYCGYSPIFEISPLGETYPTLQLPKTYAPSVKNKTAETS